MKAFTTRVNNRGQRWARATAVFVLGVMFSAAGLHDFHFSRTDVRWNPDTQTVQTTVRVFTDDLELALRNHHGLSEDVKIWLGDKSEWAQADSAIHTWLQTHLSVALDESPVQWTWVGKEVELDITYLYLESQPLAHRSGRWRASNSLLFAEFNDQVNEIHLHDVGADGVKVERREMLNAEWPSFEWDSSTPADSGSDE